MIFYGIVLQKVFKLCFFVMLIMVEHKEQNTSEVVEIPVGKYFERVRKNPWVISTIVLAIALIVVIFMKSSGTGFATVSGEDAGKNLLSFIDGLGNGNAEIVSVEKDGALYNVNVKYQGQDIPAFVTLDGEYFVAQPIPLTAKATESLAARNDAGGETDSQSPSQPPSVDVPKSDKPVVELFIMSYCPYGTQMEKGILPVLGALGDKINFTLRYTHFTLHGEKEDTENFRQICIREEQGSKFLSYIQCTLNSTDANKPGDVTQCMKSGKIDVAKVDNCIKNKAANYYAVDSQLSQKYGVQGSPTLVINGVDAQSARSPASILSTICSAFNNAPAECNAQLPEQSPSPGFGYSSSATDAAASVARC